MRARSSTLALVGPLTALTALATLAACADAPSETSPLAPRGRLASLAPAADSVSVAGSYFMRVETAPRGWVERFDVNFFPDTGGPPSPWTKPPAPWVPANVTAADAMSFTTAHVTDRAPNSLADWAVAKQARSVAHAYAPPAMDAWHHGVTCAAPPQTHPVRAYDEAPFLCRNHVMTAANGTSTAGDTAYAVTYLTPNRLVDLSAGEAVVRFDVATLRTSERDWIDLWITPYAENLVAPLEDSLPDVQGHPRTALHVRMSGPQHATRFVADLVVNHRPTRLPSASATTYEAAFAAYAAANPGHSGGQSATRRDTFELRLTGGRLRFGMPRYGLWWVDAPVASLGFTGPGVIQLGHHSFQPGSANTWHWDNVGVAPAQRFTIVNADRRLAEQGPSRTVRLLRPAPAGAMLRFSGLGENFDVRFGKGGWSRAQRQAQQLAVATRFSSYWMPVPAGATEVEFRANKVQTADKGKPLDWMARDITVWSLDP